MHDKSATKPEKPTLIIHHLSSLFFVYLIILPLPQYALLLGSQAEQLFITVDDEELFLRVFKTTFLNGIRIPQPNCLGWS